jgi:glycosyltransferase involved in cell wall biosynthesis
MRYAWDLQAQYLREAGLETGLKSWIARYMLHRLRINDLRSSISVDAYMCNSHFIRRRIWKLYRRKAQVIYPPVETEYFGLHEKKEDFYLTVSRMVPYKKIDIIAEAFSMMPDKKLVIIGDGTEFEKIKSKAGSNVQLLGYQSKDTIKSYMQRAKAFLFAAEEDFGIVPVEALACGTPVIAYGKGGVLETVKEGVNGYLYNEQTSSALMEAVKRFELSPLAASPAEIRKSAESFSKERFRKEFKTSVESLYAGFLENGKSLEE